jgi:hypothetical protein
MVLHNLARYTKTGITTLFRIGCTVEENICRTTSHDESPRPIAKIYKLVARKCHEA